MQTIWEGEWINKKKILTLKLQYHYFQTYYGNICNRLTQTHAPMYIKQTSLIGANLNCHLRYMFAKYLMEWGIRPACTGIPAMYNALRYSLHVCYICYFLDQNL